MNKLLFSLLITLLTANTKAQQLSREQMVDSIVIRLSVNSYENFHKVLIVTNPKLEGVDYIKLDCAIDKVLGIHEQYQKDIKKITENMSDSELAKAYNYSKLFSRMKSIGYTRTLQNEIKEEILVNLNKKLSNVDNTDQILALIKYDFVINDNETDEYLNIIFKTNILDQVFSLLRDYLENGGSPDQNSKEQMEKFFSSIIEITKTITKKVTLIYFTKQELKEMSEFMSDTAGERICGLANSNFEQIVSVFKEISERTKSVDWLAEVEKLSDEEVALYADRYFNINTNASPLPREKGQLTLKSGNYVGEIWNCQANGVGEITDTKGNVYKGDFLNNKKDGYGVLTSAKGVEKKGYWKQDKYIKETPTDRDYGQRNRIINGNSLTGIFKHGLLNGEGTLYDDHKGKILVQEGLFEEGIMVDGDILIKISDIKIVGTGSFDGDMNGYGITQEQFSDGDIVESRGNFKNGNLDGIGTTIMQGKDGITIEKKGLFVDGIFAGKGYMIIQGKNDDGIECINSKRGYFYNTMNGEGCDTVIFDTGLKIIYTGTFKNDNPVNAKYEEYMHGKLVLEYEGEFKDRKIHGQGVLTYANGEKVEGNWSKGTLHGNAKIYDTKGYVLEGNFVAGRCSDGVLKDKAGKVLKTGVYYSTK